MAAQIPLDRPPPSTLAIAFATAIISGIAGYFLGQGASLGLFLSPSPPNRSSGSKRTAKKSWPNSYDVNVHVDSSDEELVAKMGGKGKRDNGEEDLRDPGSEEESESEESETSGLGEGDGVLKEEFPGHEVEEVKLVLCVRTDLGMGKGKIAAQASHATLSVYKHLLTYAPNSPILKRWERHGQAKVALQVKSEDEMLTLQAQALSLGLAARVIQDAGRTQIASGTRTVLGILGPKSVVDQVTGSLKLL